MGRRLRKRLAISVLNTCIGPQSSGVSAGLSFQQDARPGERREQLSCASRRRQFARLCALPFPVILKGLPSRPRWLLCGVTVIKSIRNCFIIPDAVSPLTLLPPAQHPRALGPQDIQTRATILQTVFEDYVHADEQRVAWAKQGGWPGQPRPGRGRALPSSRLQLS